MTIEALEAQIAMMRAEEALVEAKAKHAAGEITDDELRAAKDAARQARQDYRQNHRGSVPVEGTVVNPATVETGITVEQ